MASIRKHRDKYQVRIRRSGFPTITKSFLKLADAREWAIFQERRTGTSHTIGFFTFWSSNQSAIVHHIKYVIYLLTHDACLITHHPMIRSFANKQLKALWETGKSKIDARLHGRILRRLDALNASNSAEDMNMPGFDFHSLKGFSPTRYTVHVNGPWCITFEFHGGDAYALDFEQYH